MAYTLFPTGKYTEESYKGWNGETETERTYINSSGEKLGTSHTYVDVWNDGTNDIKNTNTTFEDSSGNWVGHEWSEKTGDSTTGSGSFSVSVVKMTDTDAWAKLAKDFDWLTWEDGKGLDTGTTDGDGKKVYATSVKLETGSNVFYDSTGKEESSEKREHLISNDDNWNHYGGKEVIDGETIQWNANWERGAVKVDVGSLTKLQADMTDDMDHEATLEKAFELFGDAYYKISENDFFGNNTGEAVIAHTPANPTGERHTAHTNKRSAKWATRPPYVQVLRPVRARSARKFASCYYEIRNRAVPSVIRGSERRHRPPTGRVLCASYVGGDLIHGCPSARCTRRSRAAPTPAAATGAPADIAGGRAVVAMLRTTRPPAQRPRGELRTRSRAEPPPAARLPRSWDRRRASGCRRQRPGQRWGIARCVHSCGTECLALPSRTAETPSGESVCAPRAASQ